MQKRRLLFIVSGLGLGNSSRCDSIIEKLDRSNVDVDVMTSGNGLEYFSRKSYCRDLIEMRPLNYGKGSDGRLSMLSTLLGLPHLVSAFIYNMRLLSRQIKKAKYSCIVIDSDYTVAALKWRLKVPVVALNNAELIVRECRSMGSLPPTIRMQYLIERMDAYFHKLVPDHVLSPALAQTKLRSSLALFPPFIREGLEFIESSVMPRRILVMLSGSNFGTQTDFLENLQLPDGISIDVVGRSGQSKGSIRYHGKIFNNRELVNLADIMVINAGFSAVSEAVVLRKPCVVIPVENHAEQFINAKMVEDLGLGLVADAANIGERLNVVIRDYEKFVRSHEKYNCPSNGSELAAREIDRIVGVKS